MCIEIESCLDEYFYLRMQPTIQRIHQSGM